MNVDVLIHRDCSIDGRPFDRRIEVLYCVYVSDLAVPDRNLLCLDVAVDDDVLEGRWSSTPAVQRADVTTNLTLGSFDPFSASRLPPTVAL
ncbi:hypothetical protein D8S78_01825 [Natrialba swarupiae]|nr:hypothetical protein [Natrialba swarupiae]